MRSSGTSLAAVVLLALVLFGTAAAGASEAAAITDCESWQRLSPILNVRDLNGVVQGDPGLVAVGDGGTVLFSPDELSWRELPSPVSANLNAVAWFDGRFVAVGSGGKLITSSNGTDWEEVSEIINASLFDVAAGPEAWVAVGMDGAVARSTDGATWTVEESGTDAFLNAVTWSGSEFLAAGTDQLLLSSPDGIGWTVHVMESFPDMVRGLAASGSTTVLVGDYVSLRSTDGRQWGEIEDLAHYVPADVMWTGKRFLAVIGSGLESVDGEEWHRLGLSDSDSIDGRAITTSPHGLLIVGAGGGMTYLPKGEERWMLVSGLSSVPLEAAAVRDSTVVAVGGDGWPADAVILTSHDRSPFATAYEASHEKLLDVAASDTGFVAVGGYTELLCNPMLLYSTDGDDWGYGPVAAPTNAIPCDWAAVDASGPTVVAVGDGVSAVSRDGGWSWTTAAVGEGWSSTYCVATNGERFVALGGAGHSFTSSDGLSWIKHENSVSSVNYRSVAWGGDRFLAVGDDGVVVTSSDGELWNATGATITPGDILWTGDRFVVMGGAALYTSADGVEWTTRVVPDLQTVRGIAWDGRDLVAVGGTGMVARSTCGIVDEEGVAAEFSWLPGTVYSGLPVRFWDHSVGTISDRYWSFGDGGGSSDANPVHIFAEPGRYEVVLSVSGASSAFAAHEVEVVKGPIQYSEELFVPGVAHLAGYNGTQWRSDLEICSMNPEEETAARISLLLRDQENLTPAVVTRAIPPLSCLRFTDVVSELFGVEAAGALRIGSERPLIVNARNYTESATGSYGSFKTATAPQDGARPAELWLLSHLSQSADDSSGFRTNLGFLNLGAQHTRLRVRMYRNDGERLGESDVELGAYEYTQLLQPLSDFAPEGVEDAYATVYSVSPGARYLAGASLVDNRSGDGAAIPAVRIEH